MKYACIESTYDIERFWGKVRLWVDRDEVLIPNMAECSLVLDVIQKYFVGLSTVNEADWLDRFVRACVKEIPRLSAVQVVRNDAGGIKRGVVVYVTDFNVEAKG